MLLDIVILPPPKLRREIGKSIKTAIGSYPYVFLVDNKKLIPHLSLWHINTSRDRISDIGKELKRIVNNQKPVKINFIDARSQRNHKNRLDLITKQDIDLVRLRQKVFRKIYPYKIGAMPPFDGKWSTEKINQVQKYGKPIRFHPHVTIGWLKYEKHSPEVVKRIKRAKLNFLANEIYICNINKRWQVTKIIRKIEFAQK